MRTAVSAAALQLGAAGLGVAVCPISAGFAGAGRPFSPRWVRPLAAVTRTAPGPLTAQFIADLRKPNSPNDSPARENAANQ
ncbi:MAG: LysR family transcriptional regulator [Mycobacterium sp.]|nr:LysR family transcriptional regulator [Mycobacterium sp.]